MCSHDGMNGVVILAQIIIGGEDRPTSDTEHDVYPFVHQTFPNDLSSSLPLTHKFVPLLLREGSQSDQTLIQKTLRPIKKTALLGGFSVTVFTSYTRPLPNIGCVLIYDKDDANKVNKDDAFVCKNHPSNLTALEVLGRLEV